MPAALEEFGPYRMLARLGAGGMGEVWRASDTRKDREVAVKVLGGWLGAEPDYATRFRREAALAARLNAPNIIPIHDYGEIDGRLFMEMPLISGTDLDVLVRQGPLDPIRAVGVIEQVGEALDTAHEAGLVHRDVKPSNVLVVPRRGGGDHVYLIDFGIARPAGGTRLTATGAEMGTMAYMAPERFDGVSGPGGDVYALACVLFQALTGQAPFVAPAGASELAFYLKAHLQTAPPAPSALRTAVPAALDAVVAQGMAKDPDARYASAGALATAARAALAGAPGVTPPAPVTRVSGPAPVTESGPSRSAPVGERRLTGHSDMVTAVAVARLDGRPVVVSGGHNAVMQVWDVISGQPLGAPSVGGIGAVNAVAAARVGSQPVVVSGGLDTRLWVWDLATRRPVLEPLVGHTYIVSALATAQLDGRPVVVSGSRDRTVRVWDLATGRPVAAPFAGHSRAVFAVAATEVDGSPVAVSGGLDSSVRLSDLATGRPVWSPLWGHTDAVSAVTVAQLDGRPVVVTGSWDRTLRVWDLTTGQPAGSPLTGHSGAVDAVAVTQLDGRPVVVSGSRDRTVRVWDLATGRPLGSPLAGHAGAVHAVATTDVDGHPVVVSGSADRTVRVWDLAFRARS